MPPSSPWKGNCRLNLGLGAGALGDQPVMLDAAVLLEVEDRAFDVLAELEVECRGDHLVVFAKRAGGDLAGRRDDLDALQTHHAERLRPAAIVADAHADDGVEGAPHSEALLADIEITLFEM